MGDAGKTGQKGKDRAHGSVFGEGLLVGEVIDVVEEGNRLIQVSRMREFLRRFWISLDRCHCHRTSRIS